MLRYPPVFLVFILLTLTISTKASNYEGKTEIDSRGIVSVYSSGKWGYVCPRNWDDSTAFVACRHYNNSVRVNALQSSRNLSGWMFDVSCEGDEDNFTSCNITRDLECNTLELARAYCYDIYPDLFLSGGGRNYGYVQFRRNGKTGYLWHKMAVDEDAICNRMGFYGGASYTFNMPKIVPKYLFYTSRNLTYLDFPLITIRDEEPEFSLEEKLVPAVFCFDKLKLSGGYYFGTVIEHREKDYCFCADGFGQKEGDAICRHYGYSHADSVSVEQPGSYSPPIGFHNFTCPDFAQSFANCTSTFTGTSEGCKTGKARVTCYISSGNTRPPPVPDRSSFLEIQVVTMVFLLFICFGVTS